MLSVWDILERVVVFRPLLGEERFTKKDFIQYMLAADRLNKMVADHYFAYHPAVNRGIHKIVTTAYNRVCVR